MLDWAYVQSNYDWLGHIVEALIMALVVAVLARAFMRWAPAAIAGLAFAIGHFHGREKRDFEVSADMAPPHLEGYLMWRWSFDQMTDFWPVGLLLLAAIIVVAQRHRL